MCDGGGELHQAFDTSATGQEVSSCDQNLLHALSSYLTKFNMI